VNAYLRPQTGLLVSMSRVSTLPPMSPIARFRSLHSNMTMRWINDSAPDCNTVVQGLNPPPPSARQTLSVPMWVAEWDGTYYSTVGWPMKEGRLKKKSIKNLKNLLQHVSYNESHAPHVLFHLCKPSPNFSRFIFYLF
jgi:hypothetical protein